MKLINFFILSLFFIQIFSDQINTSFGQNGTGIITESINSFAESNAIVIDSSSKLLISGFTTILNQNYFLVARFSSEGVLDSGFGTSGVKSNLIGDSAVSTTLAIDSTGKIILGGYAIDSNISKFALAKYTTNGTLDSTFGSSGILTTQIESGAQINSIVIDSSNNIIAGGVAVSNGQALFALAKYNSLGNLVSSFGNSGIVTSSISGNIHHVIKSLKIDSNNKILAGGWTSTSTGIKSVVMRFNTDGSLDTSFNSTGVVSLTASGITNLFGKSIVLDSSNSIFIVSDNQNSKVVISKLTSAGILDTNFGDNGQVTTTIGNNTQVNAIAIDSDDNLIITGNQDTNIFVARYSSLGAIDTSFGDNGIETTTDSNSNLQSNSLVVRTDNEIIISGESGNDVLLARYKSNASVFVTISSPTNNSTLSYNQFLVTGSSSENSESVSIYIDDTLLETVTTNSLGNWTTSQLNSSLDDGTHFIKAQVFDSVSSTSATDINKIIIATQNGKINLLASNMNKNTTCCPETSITEAGSSITLLTWKVLPSTQAQEPIAVLFPIPEDFVSDPGYLNLNFNFITTSTAATGNKANLRIRANFKSSTENFAIPTFDVTKTTGDFTITQPTGSNLKVIQASVTLNPGTISAGDLAYFVFDRISTTGTEFSQPIYLSNIIINYSRDL